MGRSEVLVQIKPLNETKPEPNRRFTRMKDPPRPGHNLEMVCGIC